MSVKNPKIYIASPFGFSEAGRYFYNIALLPVIRDRGFDILDPWSLTPKEIIDHAVNLPYGPERKEACKKVNNLIGCNNTAAIMKADMVLAVLDGADIDGGTAGEIGFASALNKLILGYRGDFRPAGDNEGCIVSLQIEHFIYRVQGKIVSTLDELRAALVEFRRELNT